MQLGPCNFIFVRVIEVSEPQLSLQHMVQFYIYNEVVSRLKRKQISGAAITSSIQVREARQSQITAVGRAQPSGYW